MFEHLRKRAAISTAAGIAGAITLTVTAAGTAQGSITALYKLDEPAGSTGPVADSVGNNDGSDIGSPTRGEPGVFGTAYSFSRNPGDAVNVNSDPAVQPTGDFTITLWFNADAIDHASRYDHLLGAVDGNKGYHVFLDGSNHVRFVPVGSSTATSGVNLNQVPWYFTAIRYDTDGNSSIAVLQQMAGNASASDINSATTIGGQNTSGLTYNSGAETWLARHVDKDNNTFKGRLDDVAFFDNVLTNEQLADIYNNGAGSVIPEPTSLALLGLGGLAMLGRRRRRHV